MKPVLLIFAILFTSSCQSEGPIQKEIKGEEIDYSADGVTLKGYLAYDASNDDKRPGILVVHEWWGHNDYARKRARMLAELGYTALAVDMYGDGKQAAHPEDAGKLMMEVMSNMELAKARFTAALELLNNHETTDPQQTAAIGYCFGGAVVLQMARFGLDLDGVVSFHGSYETQQPAKPGEVKAGVLVCHGADDPFVKPESIDAFKQEMNDAGVDFEFISYEGAKHSFTNSGADEYGQKFGLPLVYNEEADKQSWADMQELFNRIFSK